MRIRASENESATIELGPMMDLVFLLLIFFIVIAVTKKSIKELGITLPEPTEHISEVKPKDQDLVIRVTKTGEMWVGDNQVGDQGLLEAIKQHAAGDNSKVRFEVDRETQMQHMMPIWDQLTHYGLTNWGMRTTMN